MSDPIAPGPVPHRPHAPPGEGFDPVRARRLLGMYVLGVAIGCLLVGMLLNAKRYFRPPPSPTPTHLPAVQPAPPSPSPETAK